jgi:hypothetical protein
MKKLAAAGPVKCGPNKITYKKAIRAWSERGHQETASTVQRLREEEMNRLNKYKIKRFSMSCCESEVTMKGGGVYDNF